MSGGSYDYLCHIFDVRDVDSKTYALREMADRLAGLGYAEDAARETEETLLLYRQFEVRMMTRIERLRGVWKAVEWWDSADSGEEGVHAALAKYRGDD